eukprot:875735_1
MSFLKWLLIITVLIHHQPLNHALSAQDPTNFWKTVKGTVLNADCDMEPLLVAILDMNWRTIEYIRDQSEDYAPICLWNVFDPHPEEYLSVSQPSNAGMNKNCAVTVTTSLCGNTPQQTNNMNIHNMKRNVSPNHRRAILHRIQEMHRKLADQRHGTVRNARNMSQLIDSKDISFEYEGDRGKLGKELSVAAHLSPLGNVLQIYEYVNSRARMSIGIGDAVQMFVDTVRDISHTDTCVTAGLHFASNSKISKKAMNDAFAGDLLRRLMSMQSDLDNEADASNKTAGEWCDELSPRIISEISHSVIQMNVTALFFNLTILISILSIYRYCIGRKMCLVLFLSLTFRSNAALFITSGQYHNCALQHIGMKCWGDNEYGQLGYGDQDNRGQYPGEMGDDLEEINLGTDFIPEIIVAGYRHTCAISTNNKLKCFGENTKGQLGYGDIDSRGGSGSPMGDDLAEVELGTNFIPMQLSAGYYHTCALSTTNKVKCFGMNYNGQLGYGDTDNRGNEANEMSDNLTVVDLGSSFVPIRIASGEGFNCAISTNNTAKCWGLNSNGQLGYGHTDKVGAGPHDMGDNLTEIDLGSGFSVSKIACARSHTCALSTNNKVKCWGQNSAGQLGLGNTFILGDEPGEMGDNLTEVDLGSDFIPIEITAAADHTCALSANHTIKCWGANNEAVLGYGPMLEIGDEPDEMGMNLPELQFRVGFTPKQIETAFVHACAVSIDNRIQCWADNGYGQLGLGDKSEDWVIVDINETDVGTFSTRAPTLHPTIDPSNAPTSSPSFSPSLNPSISPTLSPSIAPSQSPSSAPTSPPSLAPSIAPSLVPSSAPSSSPSSAPSTAPSTAPSLAPSRFPSSAPSSPPSLGPSSAPSSAPTACVDYNATDINYNSNDGDDNRTDINISPLVQESFCLSVNESVMVYDNAPTHENPVPYINTMILCDSNDTDVCYIHCKGSASCLLANIMPSSKFMERILIKCDKKFSCRSMTLNYFPSLSPDLREITVACTAPSACNEYVINLLSNASSMATELSVTIYCVESFSCELTSINIEEVSMDMNISVYCLKENSCKGLSILNALNKNINIHLWSFQFSEQISITTAVYDDVHIHCGNDANALYVRYDTSDLLNDEEFLMKARQEYVARRLPCEGIDVICPNTVDERTYNRQCSMQYKLSDAVNVAAIIGSQRDCFWININELYNPYCDGTCGQNMTIYEYPISIEFEMILGINEDTRAELYDFFKNDTSALNIDELVCDEYFGDSNATSQTLTNIDAIVEAALRFYKDAEFIHDIQVHPESQSKNGSIDCDGFNLEHDVISINSTFSVQSISPNEEDVYALFASESSFHAEVNNLFDSYYGESLVPLYVANTPNSTLAPSIDPTPGPTQAPIACPYNTFQFGEMSECFVCGDDYDGYECKGDSILNVEYSHWISAYAQNELTLSSLSGLDNSHGIISLQCPVAQCCNDHTGCNYVDALSDTNASSSLCAEHRNASSVTCSRCDDDKHELLGSAMCGECKQTNYALIVLLFILASLFSLFLLFILARPNQLLAVWNNNRSKEIDWHKLSIYDQKNLLIVLISKICMYYYQGLSQILLTKNIIPASQFEKTLLTLFDFEASSFSGQRGICFIAEIDSGVYDVLLSYTWYIFVAINVLIIALISRSISCKCNCKPYIKIGCINIILMTAGPLLSTSFKLLTCIKLMDGKYYHFYDADIACNGYIWWFAGLLPILILCSALITFWYIVYRQRTQQRENENNPYRVLTKRFRSDMWHWEFLLFCRRFGIAALTSFYGIENTSTSILLASFVVLLLALQTKFNPFKHQTANVMESMCLFGTAAIIIALIVMDKDSVYISWYLTFLIITPFVAVFIIICIIIYKWWTSKDSPLNKMHMQHLSDLWLEREIELTQPTTKLYRRQQIENAQSVQQLIPIMESMDFHDLKHMLLEYHEDNNNTNHDVIHVNSDTDDAIHVNTDTDNAIPTTIDTNTIYIMGDGDDKRDESISSINIDANESGSNAQLDTNDPDVSECKVIDIKPEDEGKTNEPEPVPESEAIAMEISTKEEQKLDELYEKDRDLWRNKITNKIRQHPQQYQIILKIVQSNNDNDVDENDGRITIKEFEKAFPGLTSNLIGCMFADIHCIGGDKEDKTVKITTILRWINSNAKTAKPIIFEEVEVVKDDEHVAVLLFYKLDKYLAYKPDNTTGKGMAIERMKRNKYGKKLCAKYGFNEEWFIDSIEGKKMNHKMKKDIDAILKKVEAKLEANKGYEAVFKKKKNVKRKDVAKKPVKCGCDHHHGQNDKSPNKSKQKCKHQTGEKTKTKTKQKKQMRKGLLKGHDDTA